MGARDVYIAEVYDVGYMSVRLPAMLVRPAGTAGIVRKRAGSLGFVEVVTAAHGGHYQGEQNSHHKGGKDADTRYFLPGVERLKTAEAEVARLKERTLNLAASRDLEKHWTIPTPRKRIQDVTPRYGHGAGLLLLATKEDWKKIDTAMPQCPTQ